MRFLIGLPRGRLTLARTLFDRLRHFTKMPKAGKVMNNGTTSIFFLERGVRQGDPLSLYKFCFSSKSPVRLRKQVPPNIRPSNRALKNISPDALFRQHNELLT